MIFFKPNFWDKNKISFFSILLFPITILIKIVTFFKPYLVKNQKHPIPIICVGNIYLGGTGKTPLCIKIFSILKELGKNPAFIRKKYDDYEDEFELQKKTGPIYQNKNRSMAIKEAIVAKINISILDDGFQDFSIKKNLSIVCFNEKKWIGNGLTIPSGPLRESLFALKRANCVVINGNKNNIIESELLKYNKELKIFYSKYRPLNIEEFKNKNVIAFAGIGNPDSFFSLLIDNNINILKKIKFPDHYNFSQKEIEKLVNQAQEKNATLLTTEKDYHRISKNYKNKISFLKILVEIKDQNKFTEEIKKII
jgi:tetraacyldisaccharide 4'-kinase